MISISGLRRLSTTGRSHGLIVAKRSVTGFQDHTSACPFCLGIVAGDLNRSLFKISDTFNISSSVYLKFDDLTHKSKDYLI